MKILITHVYSNDNKGDAALLSVLISDIRRAFESPSITILTLDRVATGEKFDEVPVKNGFMYYARNGNSNFFYKGIHGIFVAASTLLWAAAYRVSGRKIPVPEYLNEVIRLYTDADLVIPVGGGYIRGKSGLVETGMLFFILHPLWFTAILGKPTINYTQSVGPFGNRLQTWMAKRTIRMLTGIIAREKITYSLLVRWGVKNMGISVDSGFSFISSSKRDLRSDLNMPVDQMLVGITVRKWLKPKKQQVYEMLIAKVADRIIEKYGAVVVFIPQVTVEHNHDDDRVSSERAYSFMERKENAHVVRERYDHHVIKALYGGLDYLIGTRFHSVIFALTSYVPAIAIEYEHKTRGIMLDLGLGGWVRDIRELQATDMERLFDELVAQRNAYVAKLQQKLPEYIQQANLSIRFVKELYDRKLAQSERKPVRTFTMQPIKSYE